MMDVKSLGIEYGQIEVTSADRGFTLFRFMCILPRGLLADRR
jgi:hypothetical protein